MPPAKTREQALSYYEVLEDIAGSILQPEEVRGRPNHQESAAVSFHTGHHHRRLGAGSVRDGGRGKGEGGRGRGEGGGQGGRGVGGGRGRGELKRGGGGEKY